MQPTWVPPNVTFEIDDANLSWTFKDEQFDFIHTRGMIGCIADWSAFYREAFRCIKPGGYFEHHDNSTAYQSDDGSVTEDSPMGQWTKVFWEGGKKFGRTFRIVEDDIQVKCMKEAGFVDIEVRDFKCPVGTWPKDRKQKELGAYVKMILDTDLEGESVPITRHLVGCRETMQLEANYNGSRICALHVECCHGLDSRRGSDIPGSPPETVARPQSAPVGWPSGGVWPETCCLD